MVIFLDLPLVVFAPLLESLMDAFAIGPGTAGLIVTTVWVGSALSKIPAGYILTHFPRHHMVLGSGILLTSAAAVTALAPSIIVLAAGGFLMGAASGAYLISASPLVSELYPERVGWVLGIHGTATQIGVVLTPLFVSAVLLTSHWRLVFLLIAGVTVGATVLFYLTSKRTNLPTAGTADQHIHLALQRHWPLIFTGIIILATTGFIWNGLFSFYPSYLIREKGCPPQLARNMLSVAFVMGIPAFWISGRLADRLPHIPFILAIWSGLIVCLFSLTHVQEIASLVIVTAVLGYVVSSIFPVLDSYILKSLPDENRASAYSLHSGIAMFGEASGSAAVGLLIDQGYTYDSVFQLFGVGLGIILSILFFLYLLRKLPTNTVIRSPNN